MLQNVFKPGNQSLTVERMSACADLNKPDFAQMPDITVNVREIMPVVKLCILSTDYILENGPSSGGSPRPVVRIWGKTRNG